jgi:tetratricopeptide (TPR) repeat protein
MGLARTFLITAVLMMTFALPAQSSVKRARPSREQQVFNKAMDAFDRQDYAGSRRLLLALVRARPTKGLYWFNLGNAELKLKLWRSAMRSYERVVTLRSPLAPVAGIYLSKAARGQGSSDTSLRWVRWVAKRSLPPNVQQLAQDEAAYLQQDFMNEGMAAYESGQYAKAIEIFDKVASIDGDKQFAGQAGMMKGLCLLNGDRSEQAEAQFQSLVSHEGITGVQDYARYFSRLSQQSNILDPPYWLTLDIALGANSNLYGDGISTINQGATVIPYFLGGGVRVLKSGLYSLAVGDNLTGEEPVGVPSARFFGNTLYSVVKYQTPGWLVQMAEQLDYTVLGNVPYTLRPSVSVSSQRVTGDERLGLTLSVAHQLPQSDMFQYVEGNAWSLRAFWIHHGRGWTGGPFVYLIQENSAPLPLATGTVPLGYTGAGPGFSGYLNPIYGWEISGSTSYAVKSFYDLSEPLNVPRSDNTLNVYAKAARRITRSFAPYISMDITVNSSSLGVNAPEDKNYTQFIVATGVSWDLL